MKERTQTRAVNPWLVLILVSIPVFIGALDLTIVSAFLPEIIVRLELPPQMVINDAAWVVTGYLLAYTISLTFMGRVSDLVGRRAAFVACLIIFMIGSFVVAEVDPQGRQGIAGWLYNLIFRLQGVRPEGGNIALMTIIIGRIIQALGAGAIVPVSLALVGDLFPAHRRAQPLGMIGAVDTLGWVLGHLYGGVMVKFFADHAAGFEAFFRQIGLSWDAPDWRALFWLNLPISLIALVAVLCALRSTPQERAHGRFDWLGTLLISGTLISLVVGLGAKLEISSATANFSELGGLPPYALPVLALGGLMLAGFIFIELRKSDPLFDLRVFSRRNLAAGAATNLFVGFCLMIGLVSVPIMVNIRAEDVSELADAALKVGILLSALTIPMALAAVPGGWLSERVGYGRATLIGLVLAGLGFFLVWKTWTPDVSDGLMAFEMALVGVGLGLTFSPISASVINAADPDKLGAASALVILMRLLGMTLGIALLTAFASQRLSDLVVFEYGASAPDPYAAVDVYFRLTVRVLSEMGLAGAVLCLIAMIPARLMHGSEREGTRAASQDTYRAPAAGKRA
ncbi:MAG: MFS transporter [Anaerolineae bacterium]|nr:MFS transporter [Anaerolineae bacterium]